PPVDSAVAPTKLVPSSHLGHQKNNFQHEHTSKKEESLKDLCAQKSQSFSSSSYSAERSQHGSRYGGAFSAELQSKYPTSQTKTLPPKLVAKRKEGVDRAHPLKPIVHHNGVDVPVVNRAQDRSFPYREEASNIRPSSWNRGKTPAWAQLDAALSQWMAEPASHLYRRDLAYILKLEADGRILEEEIRKKEILLLEKLRRAEEELRRIQRERALQEAEERRDREAERTHEQKAARHLEEKACRTAVKPGDRVFGGVQSAEATIPKAGTTLHPRELAMGELKKVASNSKIQDRIPVERLTSYSEVPRKASPSPPALPDRDSNAHSPMQTASAMEQGGLGQCSFCGRKFLCTRLEKHMSVCDKRQDSKRKVFDSKRARARGTELEQFQQRSRTERPQSKAPRKNNWRQKHEALLQILHQAQELQKVSSKGGKLSDLPPLPPTENPDYVPCPYCGRRFAPNSAERHIPKCKNIKSRPPPPPHLRR
ncbi:ZC21C protein, partial [Thinocorus orbignyianus]|nr:ZC21C protein [Thinocorus orbignyianus]